MSDNHHQSQSRSKSPRGCSISNQSPMCNPHSLRHLGILGGTRQHCPCRPGARVIYHPDNYLKQSIDLIPGSDWYSVAQSCYFLAVQIASLCTSSTLKPVCINAHLQAASLQRRPFFGWCFQTWTSSSWFWPGFWVEKVHSNGILTAKIEEPWSTGDLSA